MKSKDILYTINSVKVLSQSNGDNESEYNNLLVDISNFLKKLVPYIDKYYRIKSKLSRYYIGLKRNKINNNHQSYRNNNKSYYIINNKIENLENIYNDLSKAFNKIQFIVGRSGYSLPVPNRKINREIDYIGIRDLIENISYTLNEIQRMNDDENIYIEAEDLISRISDLNSESSGVHNIISKADFVDQYRTTKSGIKYYNPNISDEDKESAKKELLDLYFKTSNSATKIILALHPYNIGLEVSTFDITSLYDGCYADASLIQDDDTNTNWLYEFYRNDIESADVVLWDFRSVLAYLALERLVSGPLKISYYRENVPYFVYSKILQKGGFIDDDFIRAFLANMNGSEGIKERWGQFPPFDSDAFKLFEEKIFNDPKFDQRLLLASGGDEQKINQEIDNIFNKPFLKEDDLSFLKCILENSFPNPKKHLMSYLRKHMYSKEDPYGLLGSDMNNFLSTRSNIELDQLIDFKDSIDDFSYDKRYLFKTTDGEEVKINAKVLDLADSEEFTYYKHDVGTLSSNVLKETLQTRKEGDINFEVVDENLNPITKIDNIPNGIFFRFLSENSDEDYNSKNRKKYIYVQCGDERDNFKANMKTQLNQLCWWFDREQIANVMNETLDNIPPNGPERQKYLYENVYKNPVFLSGLTHFCRFLETHSKDGYYLSVYDEKKVKETEQFINPIMLKVKSNLSHDEIDYILKDKDNGEQEYDENDRYSSTEKAYKFRGLQTLEKIRLVSQGGIVDDAIAIEMFEEYSHGTWILDKIFDMFSNGKGFLPETISYFKQKEQEYKNMATNLGQDIFNQGLSDGIIKIKKLSDFEKVLKSIKNIAKDFITSSYKSDSVEKIIETLDEMPIYFLSEAWLNEKMKEVNIDRLFPDVAMYDYRGVFTNHLDSINNGKPFVIIYNDNFETGLDEIQNLFGMEKDPVGDVIAHEIIHALKYNTFKSNYNTSLSNEIKIKYKDPWLEDPEEIEAIVYGNIPYLYNSILDHVTKMFQSNDKSFIDSLINELVDDTKKIEAYQIDKIYDEMSKDDKTNLIQDYEENGLKENQILKEYIKTSILNVDNNSLNEEDLIEYSKDISNNILQVVMNKWFNQFNIDAIKGKYGDGVSEAEEIALKIRQDIEKARRQDFQVEEKEKEDPQHYSRMRLQQLVREFPENEKEAYEELKNNPSYTDVIEYIYDFYNRRFNPSFPNNQDDKTKKELYNVYFYNDGELKIPSSLSGLKTFIERSMNDIDEYEFSNKSKILISIIDNYIKEINKYKNDSQYIGDSLNPKENGENDSERYPSEELYQLVDLLVDMQSQYGPSWIWASKKYKNINKFSEKEKKLLYINWGIPFNKVSSYQFDNYAGDPNLIKKGPMLWSVNQSDPRIATPHAFPEYTGILILKPEEITDEEFLKMWEFLADHPAWIEDYDDVEQFKQEIIEKSNKGISFSHELAKSIKSALNLSVKSDNKLGSLDDIAEDLFERSIESFGTTDNINIAGFILPSGTMLDFSGGQGGQRFEDHRDIANIGDELSSGTDGLIQFMNIGAVRVNVNVDTIYLDISENNELTWYQEEVLRDNISNFNYLIVDISSEQGSPLTYKEFDDTSNVDKILRQIDIAIRNKKFPGDSSNFR